MAIAKAAKDELIMKMIDDLLSSPMPENQKSSLRVVKALKQTEDFLHDKFFEYVSATEAATNEEMALHREIVEYLQLVYTGLKSFVDLHPVPLKNN